MGWQEEYQKLKQAITSADDAGVTQTPDAWKLVLLQTIGGFERLAKEQRRVQERLQKDLAYSQALEEACLMSVQIAANQIDGLVRAKKRTESEAQVLPLASAPQKPRGRRKKEPARAQQGDIDESADAG